MQVNMNFFYAVAGIILSCRLPPGMPVKTKRLYIADIVIDKGQKLFPGF
jgi:hypothetical protein